MPKMPLSTSLVPLPPFSTTTTPYGPKFQYSGDRCGVPFRRFIMPAEISETGEHIGRQAVRYTDTLLLFFLTNSVVAVQARVRHPTPPAPSPALELDDVLMETAGSSTESGVSKPSSSSEPGSGNVRYSHSKRYFESFPSVLKR